MALLASLFVVSGGVLVTGDIQARPAVNTAFLGVGAVLASLVGTTGASVLLIRPLLATNEERRHVAHTVVFFIFVVANIGGCLTPARRSAPVPRVSPRASRSPGRCAWLRTGSWPTGWCWPSTTSGIAAPTPARTRPPSPATRPPCARSGWPASATSRCSWPWWRAWPSCTRPTGSWPCWPSPRSPWPSRRARCARRTGSPSTPIAEVAALFAGIFLTMLPALDVLHARGRDLGLTEPWQFFWGAGLLSSFLDNAPTYLTFVAIAQSLGLPPEVAGMSHRVLAAISAGRCSWARTRTSGTGRTSWCAASRRRGASRCPSFGGYMLYSGAVLIPVFRDHHARVLQARRKAGERMTGRPVSQATLSYLSAAWRQVGLSAFAADRPAERAVRGNSPLRSRRSGTSRARSRPSPPAGRS